MVAANLAITPHKVRRRCHCAGVGGCAVLVTYHIVFVCLMVCVLQEDLPQDRAVTIPRSPNKLTEDTAANLLMADNRDTEALPMVASINPSHLLRRSMCACDGCCWVVLPELTIAIFLFLTLTFGWFCRNSVNSKTRVEEEADAWPV